MKTTLDVTQLAIQEIKAKLLTSNDLVSRISQPYYYNQHTVPQELIQFKSMLTEVRALLSPQINKLGAQKIGELYIDFSFGTFFHKFIGGLATSYFGLGECAESTYKLSETLIKKNSQDLLFVELQFPNSQKGMEKGHVLLIVNVKTVTTKMNQATDLKTLIAELPEEAIIVDCFLGKSFGAREVMPEIIKDYINAYGGTAQIDNIVHIFSFTSTALAHYQIIAANVIKETLSKNLISSQRPLDLSCLIKIDHETRLLEMLKEILKLELIGLRDENYYVYAIALLQDPEEMRSAIKLKAFLPDNTVTFFRDKETKQKQSIFIQRINSPDISKAISQHYKQSMKI